MFFPAHDPRIGTLLAFATFGAGFFARPLGTIVIGHFGDRVGRRSMLVLTLAATGVGTALIGALPGYAAIGIWAPALLVTPRVVQARGPLPGPGGAGDGHRVRRFGGRVRAAGQPRCT